VSLNKSKAVLVKLTLEQFLGSMKQSVQGKKKLFVLIKETLLLINNFTGDLFH
jgi:hypothetical protein